MVPTQSLGLTFLMLMVVVTLTAGNPTYLIKRWHELISVQEEDVVHSRLMFKSVNVELGRHWDDFKQTYGR